MKTIVEWCKRNPHFYALGAGVVFGLAGVVFGIVVNRGAVVSAIGEQPQVYAATIGVGGLLVGALIGGFINQWMERHKSNLGLRAKRREMHFSKLFDRQVEALEKISHILNDVSKTRRFVLVKMETGKETCESLEAGKSDRHTAIEKKRIECDELLATASLFMPSNVYEWMKRVCKLVLYSDLDSMDGLRSLEARPYLDKYMRASWFETHRLRMAQDLITHYLMFESIHFWEREMPEYTEFYNDMENRFQQIGPMATMFDNA